MRVTSKDFEGHNCTRTMLKYKKDKQWEKIIAKHKNKSIEKEVKN